jgi:hypothetical protein
MPVHTYAQNTFHSLVKSINKLYPYCPILMRNAVAYRFRGYDNYLYPYNFKTFCFH